MDSTNNSGLGKPIPRGKYDLHKFLKMFDLRYYDIVMHITKITIEKYISMIGLFRVKNKMPYKVVCETLKSLLD